MKLLIIFLLLLPFVFSKCYITSSDIDACSGDIDLFVGGYVDNNRENIGTNPYESNFPEPIPIYKEKMDM